MNIPHGGFTMLAADVAHYRYNLEHRLVPKLNSDEAQSKQSMDKLEAIFKEYNAQFWLNHDIKQNATLPHAPIWFD